MFDHEPILFSGLPATNFYQHETSNQFFPVQDKLEFATVELLLRRQVSFHFEGAVIPDDHVARTVISLGYLALEFRVLERMIFGLNSEAFIRGIHRRAFWHGPGFHHTIYFQTKIVMKAARVVFLNDKRRPLP